MVVLPLFSNAQHSSKGMLSIAFRHYVDENILNLDSTTYKNSLGQTFIITKFKYYVSNIHLVKTDGKEIAVPGYFLINEDEEESKKIMLSNLPSGAYTSITFIVGVDSLHNCSGAQSGALDPANAMFWTWNTGYIFLKLEGKSSSSTSPGKIFEYHIGGYKAPSNCIRTIALKFASPLKIENEKSSAVSINVNVGEMLKTPTTIDFSKLSSVTDAHNATTVADNYLDMFILQK